MNFSTAWQQLIDQIHRPDKVADAKAAINEAIAVLSSRPFARDSASATLTLVSTDYLQGIDVTTSPFTRFKKVKWLRPTGYKKMVTFRDPAKIFLNGHECLDVYYIEGTNLIFKLSALQSAAYCGYFQYHAPLVATSDTDWMLDMMWPCVSAYALKTLFGQIGDDQERARYDAEYLRLWDIAFRDLGDGTEA